MAAIVVNGVIRPVTPKILVVATIAEAVKVAATEKAGQVPPGVKIPVTVTKKTQ